MGTLVIYSQQDYQWLIYNNEGKSGMNGTNQNTYYSSPLGDIIIFNEVARPFPPRTIGTEDRVYANQFFFINEDGSYTISRYDDMSHSTKFFNTTPKIKYAYLANIYQEDDPPELVTVTDGPASGIPPTTPITNVPVINKIGVPHDIVDSKDFTLIVKSPTVSDYTLCYSSYAGQTYTDQIIFSPSQLHSSNFLQASLGTLSNTLPNANFNADNCFTFTSTIGNAFLNFNVELKSPYTIVGTNLNFTLYKGRLPTIGNREDSIDVLVNSNFHDPNFIELMCIWQEEIENEIINKARYKVSCYNEGIDVVDYVSFKLGLPQLVELQTDKIEILNWNIGGKMGCGASDNTISNTTDNIPDYNLTGSILNIDFPLSGYGLSAYNGGPQQLNTAVFEMIVELDPSLDIDGLHLAPLHISAPQTGFEVVTYPIRDFISNNDCLDISIPNNPQPQQCVWVNKVDGPCGEDECCNNFWCRIKDWIWWLISLIVGSGIFLAVKD